MVKYTIYCRIAIIALAGCSETEDIPNGVISEYHGAPPVSVAQSPSLPYDTTTAEKVTAFAETMIGTPYKFASTDPQAGFDCSGFITYVFGHFKFTIPRSSIDFTNVGRQVDPDSARRGDLILFTGTDTSHRDVGHMGIITANSADSLYFIHSTSGKQYGVVVTPLNSYYMGRFVKVIRVFDEQGKLAL